MSFVNLNAQATAYSSLKSTLMNGSASGA